jgi:predicted metal-dependent phosphoesterase TrpH
VRAPIDLHIHSNFSDGTCSVEEVCTRAVNGGMRVIALSDHDTTNGLAPMGKAVDGVNRAGYRMALIPAIELSSGDDGLTHVLGYGIGDDTEPLQSELLALRRKRAERIRETGALLNRLTGLELPPEFLKQADDPDYAVGRMHVARLLIEKQIVGSVDEAFLKYLGVGKPAYFPLRHISTEGAIGVLRRSGAVPVLAHPMRMRIGEGELDRLLTRLKGWGLMGLEAFHPSASNADATRLHRLAKKHELLVTGGSDFHGDRSMQTEIGGYPPGWNTWEQDLSALQNAVAASRIS